MSLTKAQIEARRRGVGCSELLSALGKDSRCSRLELYRRKLGELPDLDLSDDMRVRMGTLLEPVIRDHLFTPHIGHPVTVPTKTLVHPTAPLVGHPDGVIQALGAGVEIKTADKHEAEEFGEPDSDQVPIRYLVQCAGYMAITEAEHWYLAVLVGGNDFRVYDIPRDPELEDAILAGVREFWTHIDEQRPPDPMTPDDVKLRWPKSLQQSVVATDEIAEKIEDHAQMKALLKEAEGREAEVAAAIKHFMAEAGDLVDSKGKTLATWRSPKPSQPFNAKRFREEHPDLYAAYCEERPGARRFLNKMIRKYSP